MNYLELATKIAAADMARIKHYKKDYFFGCVALRQDGAIVVSTNISTQVPNGTAHAEYRCMRKAGYGSTVWVARITSDGCWGMAKPCARCETLLKNKHVKKVIYTIAENEFGVLKF